MTEEQAKKKWCPMVRSISVDIEDKDSGNRLHGAADPFEHSRCIGSDCMIWRWEEKPSPSVKREGQDTPVIVGSGYCGLAGKP